MLPDAALRTVLQRANARGFGDPIRGHTWTFDEDAAAKFDGTRLRADLGREQQALLTALEEFAQDKYAITLSREDAEAAMVGSRRSG